MKIPNPNKPEKHTNIKEKLKINTSSQTFQNIYMTLINSFEVTGRYYIKYRNSAQCNYILRRSKMSCYHPTIAVYKKNHIKTDGNIGIKIENFIYPSDPNFQG